MLLKKLNEYPRATRNIYADEWGECDFEEVRIYGGPSWDDLMYDCELCIIPAPVCDDAVAVIDMASECAHTMDALMDSMHHSNPGALTKLMKALAKYNEVTK